MLLPKFNKIKGKLLKVPKFLAERAFLFAIISLLLGLMIPTFLFYQLKFSKTKESTVFPPQGSFRFKEKEYHEILENYRKLKEKSPATIFDQSADPFRAKE